LFFAARGVLFFAARDSDGIHRVDTNAHATPDVDGRAARGSDGIHRCRYQCARDARSERSGGRGWLFFAARDSDGIHRVDTNAHATAARLTIEPVLVPPRAGACR
jgi:hypothetical protein